MNGKSFLIDPKERAIWGDNLKLYKNFTEFPGDIYTSVYSYGSVGCENLRSTVCELDFHSNKSYMFHEIVELVHLNNRKLLSRFTEEPFIDLVAYLNLTGFANEGYTLAEFIDILSESQENPSPPYVFGYASTDPIITEFIQNVSPKISSHVDLQMIKFRLTKSTQTVIKALQQGVPDDLVKEILLGQCNFWVFNLYPSIFGNKTADKLFLKLSRYHNGPISAEMASRLVNLEHFLVRLSYLQNDKVAMGKTLLMIYFPEDAQFIYNSPDPMLAFKAILMKKLTKWRCDVAKAIDWEGNLMKGIPLLGCHFNFIRDYYHGYKENSMFDDFVTRFSQLQHLEQLEGAFMIEKVSNIFFQDYRVKIIEREPQGTVYSIVRDRYKSKLKWKGSIDPLSKQISPAFESDCVDLLALEYAPNILWLSLKYAAIMAKTPVPISRLTFNSDDSVHSLISYYCRNDRKASDKAIRKVYKSLTNYLRPRRGYQKKRWDHRTKKDSCELYDLFEEIWADSIRACDPNKSLEIVMITLERNQIDSLTRKLLLQILKSIVELHFPFRVVMKMDFTTWADPLKNQLCAALEELQGRDDSESVRNSPLTRKRHYCGCIIT